MKTNTPAEGLTLVVLTDQSQAKVDETRKEKNNIKVKAVDSSRKSKLQLINVVMFIVMIVGNGTL